MKVESQMCILVENKFRCVIFTLVAHTCLKYRIKGGQIMEELNKSVVPVIESVYENFTALEKNIADFFINNVDKDENFSAINISEKLHVSEATLTRFSKKCGYSGYREFIYIYKTNISENPKMHRQTTEKVLSDYDEILGKSYSLINEEQMEHLIQYVIDAERVYFYGIGSSGLAALEMKSRFMRLGLHCDAFTDPDMIKMNSSILDENCLVIALSISSTSPIIVSALKKVHKSNAKSVLFTANINNELKGVCNEIVSVATSKNLSFGNRISPQIPLLLMIDIFYAHFLNSDINTRREFFTSTLLALDEV